MQPINKTSRRVCLGAGLLALLLTGSAVAEPPMGQDRGERYRHNSEQRYRDRDNWSHGDRDESRRPRETRRVERAQKDARSVVGDHHRFLVDDGSDDVLFDLTIRPAVVFRPLPCRTARQQQQCR